MSTIRFAVVAVFSLWLAACAEADEARLDHAQILAVRSEPANIAPGEKARIGILAGDDAGTVFEASPETLVALGAQGPAAVEHTADGWFVTAGAVDDVIELAVTLTIDGFEWPAIKKLRVHTRVDNPSVEVTIDGNPATETSGLTTMVATVGTKLELTAIATGVEPYTYAWYSSVGDLELYRQPTAILDAAERKEGELVLVVRDATGGVSWKILPARVE